VRGIYGDELAGFITVINFLNS